LRRKLKGGNEGIKIGPFGSQLKLEHMTEVGYKVYGQEHVIAGDFKVGWKHVGHDKFSELAACSVSPGDLLITMMGTSGRCHLVPIGIEPGIMDSHLLRLRVADELDPAFAGLVLDRAHYIAEQIRTTSKGVIMEGLNSSIVKDLKITIPSPPEQQAILQFLYRETAKIDALISKREQLIALLEEKRVALISRAVTQGLDPHVPMKDSGVERLGRIPTHWNVKRLKYVVQRGLVNGLFKKKEHFGSGVKLVNVVDLYRDDFLIDFASLDRVEADDAEVKAYAVAAGDIFFVRSSLKLEGVGASACISAVPEPTVFECHVVKVTPSEGVVSPDYMSKFLNSTSARQRLIALSETTTMTTIAQPKLGSLEIPVPPLDEQKAISSFLSRGMRAIRGTMDKVREGIDKLQEYRTALISAAVTGNIDVRGEVQ
jgi:type I restriction enzyme S subunit